MFRSWPQVSKNGGRVSGGPVRPTPYFLLLLGIHGGDLALILATRGQLSALHPVLSSRTCSKLHIIPQIELRGGDWDGVEFFFFISASQFPHL